MSWKPNYQLGAAYKTWRFIFVVAYDDWSLPFGIYVGDFDMGRRYGIEFRVLCFQFYFVKHESA